MHDAQPRGAGWRGALPDVSLVDEPSGRRALGRRAPGVDTAVAVDACPRVYSTDGGAHTNTVNGTQGCHAPTWVRSNVGLHALWAWTMDGANRAGDAAEDL